MVEVVFVCGQSRKLDPDKDPSPVCAHCGTKRIAYTLGVSPPRITGHARGPIVKTTHLGPTAVSVAKTPLVLKKDGNDG
jgi:hypothetical protein